jgi:hypothetical protein
MELIRVWPQHRDATSFTGIGEYFGGTESTTGRTVLRTEPASRTGFYWLIRTRSAQRQSGLTLKLEVIPARDAEPLTVTFPLELPAGSHPIYAGLTDNAWSAADARPLAWRIQFLDTSTGEVLAESSSFLWKRTPEA